MLAEKMNLRESTSEINSETGDNPDEHVYTRRQTAHQRSESLYQKPEIFNIDPDVVELNEHHKIRDFPFASGKRYLKRLLADLIRADSNIANDDWQSRKALFKAEKSICKFDCKSAQTLREILFSKAIDEIEKEATFMRSFVEADRIKAAYICEKRMLHNSSISTESGVARNFESEIESDIVPGSESGSESSSNFKIESRGESIKEATFGTKNESEKELNDRGRSCNYLKNHRRKTQRLKHKRNSQKVYKKCRSNRKSMLVDSISSNRDDREKVNLIRQLIEQGCPSPGGTVNGVNTLNNKRFLNNLKRTSTVEHAEKLSVSENLRLQRPLASESPPNSDTGSANIVATDQVGLLGRLGNDFNVRKIIGDIGNFFMTAEIARETNTKIIQRMQADTRAMSLIAIALFGGDPAISKKKGSALASAKRARSDSQREMPNADLHALHASRSRCKKKRCPVCINDCGLSHVSNRDILAM